MELGQLDEALKHFNLAIQTDNTNMQYFFNRGFVYSKLDMVDKAIADYSAAEQDKSKVDDLPADFVF